MKKENILKILYLYIKRVINDKEKGKEWLKWKNWIRKEIISLIIIMYVISLKWERINKRILSDYSYRKWNISKRNELNWYKRIMYNYNKNEEINKNVKSKLISNLIESILVGIEIKKKQVGKWKKQVNNIKWKKVSIFISKPVIREKINQVEINFYYYIPSYRLIKLYQRVEKGLRLWSDNLITRNNKLISGLKNESLISLKPLYKKWLKINNLRKRNNIKEIIRNKKYTWLFISNMLLNNVMLEIIRNRKMNKYLSLLTVKKGSIKLEVLEMLMNTLELKKKLSKEILISNELKRLLKMKKDLKMFIITKELNKLKRSNLIIKNGTEIKKRIKLELSKKWTEINLRIKRLKELELRELELKGLNLKERTIRLRIKKLYILFNNLKMNLNKKNEREIKKGSIYKLRKTRKWTLLKKRLLEKVIFVNKRKLFILKRKWNLRNVNEKSILYNNKLSMYYLTILLNVRLVKELSKNSNLILKEKLSNKKILLVSSKNEINLDWYIKNESLNLKRIYKKIIGNKVLINKRGKDIKVQLESLKESSKRNWLNLNKKNVNYYYNSSLSSMKNQKRTGLNEMLYKLRNTESNKKIISDQFKKEIKRVVSIKRLENKKWYKKLTLRLKKRQGYIMNVKNTDMVSKSSLLLKKSNVYKSYINNELNLSLFNTYYIYNSGLFIPKMKKNINVNSISKRENSRILDINSSLNNVNRILIKRNIHILNIQSKEIRGENVKNVNMVKEIKNLDRKIRIRNVNQLLKRNKNNRSLLVSKLSETSKKSVLNYMLLNIDQVLSNIGILKENNVMEKWNNSFLSLKVIIRKIYNKRIVIKGIGLKYEYNNNEILLKLIKKGINKRNKSISRKLRFKLENRIKLISKMGILRLRKRELNKEFKLKVLSNEIKPQLRPKNQIKVTNKLSKMRIMGFVLKLKGKLGNKKGKVRKSKQIIKKGSMAYIKNDSYILNKTGGNMLSLTSDKQVKEGKIGVVLNISYI